MFFNFHYRIKHFKISIPYCKNITPQGEWMDIRCWLGQVGNSCNASGSNDAGGSVSPNYSQASGLLFFVSTLLLSIFTLFFLPSSSVSLSYFNLAVPMLKCSRAHMRMSTTFPVDELSRIFFFALRSQRLFLMEEECC